MNRTLRASFFLVFTAASFFSRAQNQNLESVYTETIQVHVNTNFLITGETLYYSIHCLNSENRKYSTLSKLAYVELIGENEKSFLQIKVPFINGRGAGDFFLPSTLPSGNYTLIAYTKWMRNFEVDNFFQQQITIINPYVKPTAFGIRPDNKSGTEVNADQKSRTESSQIEIHSDKKKYSSRQKVIVTIKNNDPIRDCNISFNVHSYEAMDPSASGSNTPSLPKTNSTKAKSVTFLPDLRGETIGGIVKHISTGQPIANANIYLSAPGASYIFQISKTDSVGRFYFSIKNIRAQDGLQFQVDHPSGAIDVILDDEFVNNYKKFKPRGLLIDTSMRKRIEQRNVYGQIENAYFIKKRDSILTVDPQPFFDIADKVYKLDDYTRFPTMEDIFREYMYEVAVTKRDGKFSLRLVNNTTKNGARFANTPLLLVDGIPIFDTEVLMSYNPLLIKTVSFITRPYVYGGVLYDGILSANTYTGNAKELMTKPVKKDYTSWQHRKTYYSPSYSTPERNERVPDYRIQLFWNPTITIAAGQALTIEFFSSDVEGKFLMEAKGFNSTGDAIDLSQTFEVQK